eukprot:jgi/Mesvir1/16890/Mv15768-RA.1
MEPPAQFLCPISCDLMRDPVMLVETGQTYERAAIEQWFARGNNTDPLTNKRVADKKVVPLSALRSLVEEWVEQQQERQRLGIAGSNVQVPQIAQDQLTLSEVLHDGAMATVSAAILQPGGQQVVVKVFRARGLTEEDSAKFRREVQILHHASLFCHNVCRLIGVASISSQLCMVMPRYKTSLDAALRQLQRSEQSSNTGPASKGMPFDRTLAISLDIALAVADLHERGIMVLDLKPANVLLDKYGRAVVADFGSSALRNHTLSLYMPTSAQGTPNYMAPEQWVPDEFGGVTTAADAWAFGCILVEMASGAPPWAGLSMFQMMANVTAPRKMCPAIPEGLPSALAELLHRCFSYQPANRPAFAEIITVLRQPWMTGLQPAPPLPKAAKTSLERSMQACPKTATEVVATAGVKAALPPAKAPKTSLEGSVEASPKTASVVVATSAVRPAPPPPKAPETSLEGSVQACPKPVAAAAVVQSAKQLQKAKQPNLQSWLRTCPKTAKGKLDLPRSFLQAAEEGRMDAVRHFVNQGVKLSVTDEDGYNAPLLAASEGHLEAVKFLVEEKRMNPDTRARSTGSNALHLAALGGHLRVVSYLVEERRMNLETTNKLGENALHCAAMAGHLDVVQYLVEDKGMSVDVKQPVGGCNALHRAALEGHLEVVKYLVDNRRMSPETKDDNGGNLLHCAGWHGNLELVKYLVEGKRMKLNGIASDGRNVLHYAAWRGHLELVKYLVEDRRMSLDALTKAGANPLHIAASGGHLEVVKYLVEDMGMSLASKDRNGWTVLRYANANHHLAVVEYLVEDQGMRLDFRDLGLPPDLLNCMVAIEKTIGMAGGRGSAARLARTPARSQPARSMLWDMLSLALFIALVLVIMYSANMFFV